jgi:hypothetical protein
MTASAQPLARFPLIDGQLDLVVNDMTDAAGRYFVYASQGMARIGAPELVFVIRQPAGEQAKGEQFPGMMIRTLFQVTAQGNPAVIGSTTVLGERTMDGDPRISGFTYTKAPEYLQTSAQFDRPPLLVVPLVDDEASVARRYGAARVLALLGAQVTYFPFPWWFAPGRPAVVREPEYGSATILANAASLDMFTSQVVHAGDRLDLWLPADRVGYLHQMLGQAPDAAFALLPGVSAMVAKQYTWRPGQTQPHANAIKGREADVPIGCNHLMILRGQSAQDYAQFVEDGICLMLTLPGYGRLAAAVAGTGPAELPLAPGAARVFGVRRL